MGLSPSKVKAIAIDCWIGNNKPRGSCNAAVAYTLLKDRECGDPWDVVAILGNLCDYSLRLDTTRLTELGIPIETCILSLSLMNGDLSLLAPEHYWQAEARRRGKLRKSSTAARDTDSYVEPRPSIEDFEFLHNDGFDFKRLSAQSMHTEGPVVGRNSINLFRLSEQKCQIPGSLWEISHFIKLEKLRDYYAEDWFNLRRPHSSPRRGLHIISKRVVGHSRVPRAIYLAKTQILFDVLLHLRRDGEVEVADAIWQSTMNAGWAKSLGEHIHSRGTNAMIESVNDFPAHLRLECRKGMFDLNDHQTWLIDQIVQHGGLWAARYAGTERETDLRSLRQELKPEALQGNAVANTALVDAEPSLGIPNSSSDQSDMPVQERRKRGSSIYSAKAR